MSIEHIHPPGLATPRGYSHVVVATGGRTIYVAGQGAFDEQGKLVGPGDYALQTKKALENLVTALGAAGATPEDVVKATFYVVKSDSEAFKAFMRGMSEAFGGSFMPPCASTYLGVEGLAYDGMLVEIDAIAVTDAS